MKRILVVEDYPSLQKLYQLALEAKGFEVRIAPDGQEALDMAREQEPDLILLDLLLPRSGGLEFLREYDLSKHPRVKVVVFSNMGSLDLFQEAKELGATDYMLKAKFTPKEMAVAVQKMLQNPDDGKKSVDKK